MATFLGAEGVSIGFTAFTRFNVKIPRLLLVLGHFRVRWKQSLNPEQLIKAGPSLRLAETTKDSLFLLGLALFGGWQRQRLLLLGVAEELGDQLEVAGHALPSGSLPQPSREDVDLGQFQRQVNVDSMSGASEWTG